MSLLRATVLLFLLTSSVLAQTLPPADTDPNAIHDENYLINENSSVNMSDDLTSDSLVDDTLSKVPSCAANYSRMSIANRRIFQNLTAGPFALCVRNDGYFVASAFGGNIYMYDSSGWMVKKLDQLTKKVIGSMGCAFARGKLFYCDLGRKKIHQLSRDGKYEKVFATGYRFSRMTARGNLLYAAVVEDGTILAYDINTGTVKYRIKTSSESTGLAFDRSGLLYVTNFTSTVQKFTYKGEKRGEVTYPQAEIVSGILIDGKNNVIIADGHKSVLVFNKNQLLIKRITGFNNPIDVAMGHNCKTLLVAEYERSKIYLL